MALPSFPDIHVTGPVHHYIQIPDDPGPGGAHLSKHHSQTKHIYYLGTAEITPQIQITRYRQTVLNDLSGKSLPIQKTLDGEAATVSVMLTRFSKIALDRLARSGMFRAIHTVPGVETKWSRGSPVFGNTSVRLWQVFENFFAPPHLRTIGLEIGWFWPNAELFENTRVKLGTQAEVPMLVFDCYPIWIKNDPFINAFSDQAVGGIAAYPQDGWMLYSHDPAFFPEDVRAPQ